ncbi:hypothetical protein CYLTODRAFT_459389 [Cylindrobasidium torrendii FP15055 ss-10]|uniref:Uncharacterized protein n=1 Tax=Cylindrobasidium torrendii FP15055 ss-10 TaxID=1314674 RepID=A0A0D7AXH0_9AGAR|nr:hypothetical protein CYLTODRAFT_459389 [Cylindrobasidium torrendii FP15055 ss-10]
MPALRADRILLRETEAPEWPDTKQQRLFQFYLEYCRTGVRLELPANTDMSTTALEHRLATHSASFLMHRLGDCGVRDMRDFRLMAGLTLSLHHMLNLRIALGLRNWHNWRDFQRILDAIRGDEEAQPGRFRSIPGLQRQKIRDKWRRVAVCLADIPRPPLAIVNNIADVDVGAGEWPIEWDILGSLAAPVPRW